MAWLYLITAGVFEVGFTTCLKKSNNFTDWRFALGFLVCATISFGLLSVALRSIPLGTAYAVWTGIGAAGTVMVGIYVFGDPTSLARMFFLALLVGSIVGLRLV